MFDLFIEVLTMAGFIALHALLVLALIFCGMALEKLAADHNERQHEKTLDFIRKNDER